jgi:hypothetical protein
MLVEKRGQGDAPQRGAMRKESSRRSIYLINLPAEDSTSN